MKITFPSVRVLLPQLTVCVHENQEVVIEHILILKLRPLQTMLLPPWSFTPVRPDPLSEVTRSVTGSTRILLLG